MQKRQRDARGARLVIVALVASLAAAGCGGGPYGKGATAARNGDWDTAVEYYRKAVQDHPNKTEYRIALERAMINASTVHLDQARVLEARGQLDEALIEYRRAAAFDPPNRMLNAKVLDLERRIRDQLQNSQPKPTIQQLRERARQ